uniref:DUF2726 domain-containing protein n=1 Tax=Caulobacter sp. (strain K31) TaxID=366602 RepID=B0T9H6_CAUSK
MVKLTRRVSLFVASIGLVVLLGAASPAPTELSTEPRALVQSAGPQTKTSARKASHHRAKTKASQRTKRTKGSARKSKPVVAKPSPVPIAPWWLRVARDLQLILAQFLALLLAAWAVIARERVKTAEAMIEDLQVQLERNKEHDRAVAQRMEQLSHVAGEVQVLAEQRDGAQDELAALRTANATLTRKLAHRKRYSDEMMQQTLDKALAHASPVVTPSELLNDGERFVRSVAEPWARDHGLKLLAQVNMGGFIKPQPGAMEIEILATYNAKRVDFLVCAADDTPLFVIEHQGPGHLQGNAEARDEIKRRVLHLAGLGLVETYKATGAPQILRRLDYALAHPKRVVPAWRRAPWKFRPGKRARSAA